MIAGRTDSKGSAQRVDVEIKVPKYREITHLLSKLV